MLRSEAEVRHPNPYAKAYQGAAAPTCAGCAHQIAHTARYHLEAQGMAARKVEDARTRGERTTP